MNKSMVILAVLYIVLIVGFGVKSISDISSINYSASTNIVK